MAVEEKTKKSETEFADKPKKFGVCSEQEYENNHKKGIKYFIIAFVFLVISIIVAFAQTIFGLGVYTIGGLIGLSIFALIGLIISIGFWVFLILGIYVYFKCTFKSALN